MGEQVDVAMAASSWVAALRKYAEARNRPVVDLFDAWRPQFGIAAECKLLLARKVSGDVNAETFVPNAKEVFEDIIKNKGNKKATMGSKDAYTISSP
eukprot:1241572-Lingulodinium_polyedra.AAC.1